MSGITLAQAQAILDALVAQQVEAPIGTIGSVSVGGRSISYQSPGELIKLIDYWNKIVVQLKRGSRTGYSVANFRSCR